jgi:hypothetical protein
MFVLEILGVGWLWDLRWRSSRPPRLQRASRCK